MNYYNFHIGDYFKCTRHLTNEEDLCYRRLLDWQYQHEIAIPEDTQKIARVICIEKGVVEAVLDEFFVKNDEGWVNKRVFEEISKYRELLLKSSAGGKASAAARGKKGVLNEDGLEF